MKLGYKPRLVLLIAAQLLALTLVALFSYHPSITAIRKVEEEIAALTEKQAELCRLIETDPDPGKDIAAAQAEIERLENRIPSESRVSWLSARLADAMRAHNIDLRSATNWTEAGEKPSERGLKRLQKTLTVRCSAKNLQAFLEAINQLSFVVIVQDLAVTRDQKWGAVSATIKLATFVLRVPSEVHGLVGGRLARNAGD